MKTINFRNLGLQFLIFSFLLLNGNRDAHAGSVINSFSSEAARKDGISEVKLSYTDDQPPARTISIKNASNEEEIVWRSVTSKLYSVLPLKSKKSDEYANAKILCVARDDKRLAIVIEFTWDKKDPRIPFGFMGHGWFQTKEELEAWDGKIQLFRSFFKEADGKWHIEATVFVQTVWKSVRDEKIIDIDFGPDGSYLLKYSRAWTVKKDLKERYGYKKVITDAGSNIKKILFDKKLDLMTTVNDEGLVVCVAEARWWFSEDERNVDELNQMKNSERLRELAKRTLAAQQNNIPLRNTEQL